MAVEGAFLEAHSYTGGLRHTPLTDGEYRPAWAPRADSVGWRDEFPLGLDDTVVEFSQREAMNGGTATWLAVFHRSTDTRLGDRGNHAGVGVWLLNRRIVDPRALVNALHQLSRTLARAPDPAAIANDAASFSSERFLGAYVTAAEQLPIDWRGAPASASSLVNVAYRFKSAQQFEDAAGAVAEEIARASLDWTGRRVEPRTLILVSPRHTPPPERMFEPLPPVGTFLADVLEQLPQAFAGERDGLRAQAEALSAERARLDAADRERQDRWRSERDAQQAEIDAERTAHQERWERERREWEMLDGKPASAEGIAHRLNTISRQLHDIDERLRAASAPKPHLPPRSSVERPRAATPSASLPASPASNSYTSNPASRRKRNGIVLWTASGLAALAVVLVGYLFWSWRAKPDPVRAVHSERTSERLGPGMGGEGPDDGLVYRNDTVQVFDRGEPGDRDLQTDGFSTSNRR